MGEYRYRKERTEEILIAVLALAGLALALHIFAFHGPSVPSGYTSSSEGAIGIAPPYKIGRGTEPVSKETGGALSNTSNKRVVQNFEQEEVRKPDTDGDGFSDWFEEHYTHTDPKVPNDRYVLFLTTLFGSYHKGDTWWTEKDIFLHFWEKNKVPRGNIIIDNATTFSEFKQYINWLKEKSDENDFVYIYIDSHGTPHGGFIISKSPNEYIVVREPGPEMEFADDKGNQHGGEVVSYKKIGEMLNEVKCNKMLVITSSCAYNSSVDPLCEKAIYPRVCAAPISSEAIGSPWPIPIRINEWIDPATGMICHEWIDPYTGEVKVEKRDPKTGAIYCPEYPASIGARDIYKREFLNGPYGPIGDEYLTVKKWLDNEIELVNKEVNFDNADDNVRKYGRIKISDRWNISGEFYFGEVKIKNYYPVV